MCVVDTGPIGVETGMAGADGAAAAAPLLACGDPSTPVMVMVTTSSVLALALPDAFNDDEPDDGDAVTMAFVSQPSGSIGPIFFSSFQSSLPVRWLFFFFLFSFENSLDLSGQTISAHRWMTTSLNVWLGRNRNSCAEFAASNWIRGGRQIIGLQQCGQCRRIALPQLDRCPVDNAFAACPVK